MKNKTEDKIIVYLIDALDHFSTVNKAEKMCISRFVGEYVGEDDNYIILRHIKADIQDDDSAEELHKVLKSTILNKLKFEENS